MYQLTDSDVVIKWNGDIAMYIPNDPGNTDRIEYQAWLDAGNTPEPAE